MATYSATFAVVTNTLVPGVIDTVTLQGCEQVEVLNESAAGSIDFTIDNSDPIAGGNDTYHVPAIAGAKRTVSAGEGSIVTIQLISAGPAVYSVTRIS
jgi:hypothetical protein